YDFHYDSNVEIKLREKGINPMSEDYQREVNLRRFALGVEPFMGKVGIDDLSGLISSYNYCKSKLIQSDDSN
ncbi:hypothetical protein, partial [Vibrio genomosp. F10]